MLLQSGEAHSRAAGSARGIRHALEDFVSEFWAFWDSPEGLFQFSRGFHGFTAFDDHLGRRRAHLTSSDRSASVPRTGSNEGRCRRRRALSKMSFCNKVSSMDRALVQYEELQVRVLHLCTSLGSTFRTNASKSSRGAFLALASLRSEGSTRRRLKDGGYRRGPIARARVSKKTEAFETVLDRDATKGDLGCASSRAPRRGVRQAREGLFSAFSIQHSAFSSQ